MFDIMARLVIQSVCCGIGMGRGDLPHPLSPADGRPDLKRSQGRGRLQTILYPFCQCNHLSRTQLGYEEFDKGA